MRRLMLLVVLVTACGGAGDRQAPAPWTLEPSLVPADRLVDTGLAAGVIPALDHPAVMRGDEVAAFNAARRGKYLVPGDRVVGLAIGGVRRAYPLRVLVWHEVVNDRVAGMPVAVTHAPLTASTVVFDRRVGGAEVSFGVSGRLYNSNLLMYDRGEATGGLWSQLQARALTGPHAGTPLVVLPASVATWKSWLERYPDTTVLRPDAALLRRYQRNPYGPYAVTGRPRFPVDPLPGGDRIGLMRPVIAVGAGPGRTVRLLDRLPPGPWAPPGTGGASLWIDRAEGGAGAIVAPSTTAPVVYAAWFAWYAHHPDTRLPDPGPPTR